MSSPVFNLALIGVRHSRGVVFDDSYGRETPFRRSVDAIKVTVKNFHRPIDDDRSACGRYLENAQIIDKALAEKFLPPCKKCWK